MKRKPSPDSRTDYYFISGRKETWQNEEIEYAVHILRFLADQRHDLKHPSYLPTPVLNEQVSQFHVSSENVVKYVTSQSSYCIPHLVH
jgi:hypothetical protein